LLFLHHVSELAGRAVAAVAGRLHTPCT